MAVKIKFLGFAICLAGLPMVAAARQQPAPAPSGIVVHLFGQDSVLSNVLPTAREGARGAAQAEPGAATPPPDVAPSTGDILHQMFVTGDPNDPTQPSQGRVKQRLAD